MWSHALERPLDVTPGQRFDLFGQPRLTGQIDFEVPRHVCHYNVKPHARLHPDRSTQGVPHVRRAEVAQRPLDLSIGLAAECGGIG